MKKIFTIVAIAAAAILSASCAKEIEGEFQKEGIIAHASLQPVDATKAIGEYSYNIVWEENDKIAVLDNAGNKTSFKLTDGASTTTGTFQQDGTDALTAPLTAYYPASVVAEDKSIAWPATQADVKNITNVPMTAESLAATDDVNFPFKHLGSVLQLVLTAKNGEINVKQIDITADQGLSGAFTVENGAAVISNTGTAITTGDISAKNIKLTATASYLNFAVPSGSFTNFKITITDIDGKEYSISAKNLTLERAMVNKVTFAIGVARTDIPLGSLSGVFSVSPTVKVRFSQGNLFYNGFTESYCFEENQYDNARGPLNRYHQGFFHWNKDEYLARTTVGERYDIEFTDVIFTNKTTDTPNPDFTVMGEKGVYRTLSSDEASYLLKGPTRQGLSSKNITVLGHKECALLYPDGYDTARVVEDGDTEAYDTIEEWAEAQAEGIVCFPATGYVYPEGNPSTFLDSYYLLSDLSSTPQYTQILKVDEKSFSVLIERTWWGFPIRLVSDASNASSIGDVVTFNGVEGMYVTSKLIVATKNLGASTKYDKGTAYARENLGSLSIPSGWQLPTEEDMAVLARLAFVNDAANDGVYNNTYDFFIPYTQDVADNKREGRLWVIGGTDNDFYWFRSDSVSGLTTTATANPNYYVRLVKRL